VDAIDNEHSRDGTPQGEGAIYAKVRKRKNTKGQIHANSNQAEYQPLVERKGQYTTYDIQQRSLLSKTWMSNFLPIQLTGLFP
jgi:hypothetical protein